MNGNHGFLDGICPKVNETACFKFELANFEAADQYFSYYVTVSPTDFRLFTLVDILLQSGKNDRMTLNYFSFFRKI